MYKVTEEKYLNFTPTGNLEMDVKQYFAKFGCLDTYEHTLDVVNELEYMRRITGTVEAGSRAGCLCHDLGRVVRNDEILEFCSFNNIEVTDEEKTMPSILHQKISCFIAQQVFKIDDPFILKAARYHTTLRRNAEMTEIEVFLADKMSWRETEYASITKLVKDALTESKEEATFRYLSDLDSKKDKMKLYHQDSKEAFEWIRQVVADGIRMR